jgi:cysteinyl-tRNA synthetase
VCNLTDIDDKIIRRMARDKISLQDLTDKYAQVSHHSRYRQIRTQGGGVGPSRRCSLYS